MKKSAKNPNDNASSAEVLACEKFNSKQRLAVLMYEALNAKQKEALLEQWELDEVDREVAEEENMEAGESLHLLRKIKIALHHVRSRLPTKHHRHDPTKHGL